MRFFLIALLVHIGVISFVWVGFSVPKGSEQNSFTYLGDLVSFVKESSYGDSSKAPSKFSDTLMDEDSSSAFFVPWLKMRQIEKPRS